MATNNAINTINLAAMTAHTLPANITGSTAAVASVATSHFIQQVVRQVFVSTGTYTPTTGMTYCDIEVVGGGDACGGSTTTGGGQASAAAGGGGGGYTRKIFTGAQIGASQTVKIGAGGTPGIAGGGTGGTGGTTSVGALISATGGVGGSGNTASSTYIPVPGRS